MNKLQMFSLALAAVLAGPVHAQVCSGGNSDGGMDATGNQCNTLDEVAASATAAAIAPQKPMIGGGSVRASISAVHPAVHYTAKTSSRNPAPTATAVPASSKLRAATSPSVPAKTAETASESEAFCSGGAGGGMDVNGNEC
jgi:hypothetical protein